MEDHIAFARSLAGRDDPWAGIRTNILIQTARNASPDKKKSNRRIDQLFRRVYNLIWAAIPPRQAARIAIETAEALDRRLEGFPPALLEEIYVYNNRWVVRALHRGEHLDDVDVALKS